VKTKTRLGAPPHLARMFPGLALPYVPLGQFPTPLEPLEAISRATGAEVLVKREDKAGEDYGGNKVRKLELLLGRALAEGKTRVITFGALGSHHALATTLYARRLGLDVTLVLYPQPVDDHVIDDLICDHGLGAKLVHASSPAAAMVIGARELLRDRKVTLLIPPGGSDATGAVGHVEAGLELAAQLEGRPVEAVFVAYGTGGTAAGLALGLALAGVRSRVVAVRVVPRIVTTEALLTRLVRGARATLRKAGARLHRAPVSLEIEPGFLGPGYGVATPASEKACKLFKDAGLTLETTYTGKTAAALLARAERGKRYVYFHSISSVDLAPRVAGVDAKTLPEVFHPYLREARRI
jgi:D-cysteine desulfhydrase